MDFNAFIDEFANLVAEKVIQKQRLERARLDWPKTTSNSVGATDIVVDTTVNGLSTPSSNNTVVETTLIDLGDDTTEDEVILNADEAKVANAQPIVPKLATDSIAARVSALKKVDIRSLRNKVAAVENKSASDYTHLNKEELALHIAKLEAIIGRTLEQEIDHTLKSSGLKVEETEIPDDTDDEIPEPEDDNDPGVLTREQAEGLDLKELKVLAISQGVSEDDLKGLDIEAVVDLLYGKEAVTEPPVTSEEDSEDSDEDGVIELDIDEIKNMSVAELKKLADELNGMGAEIAYTRTSSRDELLKSILDCVEEE